MRIFKNRWFTRFAHKERIDDEILSEAIERAGRGLIDADLGGGLIKQRIARAGEGKSGGFRSIIIYKSGDRAIFVYGFAKSEQGNIDHWDLKALKSEADEYLKLSDQQLSELVAAHKFMEID